MRSFTFAAVIALWACTLADSQTLYGLAGPADSPVDSSVDEDSSLNMTQLVSKYGYPVERHVVQTEDGYLLSVYRIPYGRKCGNNGTAKVPVLLQHGLLSSSFDYVIMGPSTALAYLLADDCYDVWLGNNRGNGLSNGHVSLSTKNKKFWSFSWHEMGLYDVPAVVDHILKVTNQPSLHYMGHSQGTTQFFAFATLRPDYQHKIRTMHALSPVAFMRNLSSPMIKMLSNLRTLLEFMAKMAGLYELVPSENILNILGAEICKNKYPGLQSICCNVMFLLCGFDAPQLNKTMLPAIVGHTPAGTGIGPVIHYAQLIHSDNFARYDFGWKNNEIYKTKKPPSYPVEKINVPIAAYYGPNDFLASLKDVKKLLKKLPNVIEDYLVPYSKFNHLDFLFASDVKKLLYDRVLEVLDKHRRDP